MRIVAGELGGRILKTPKGRDIRPTSDKIRGAIFNSLQSRGAIEGAHVLDCFCGTGALGLEALSRGAESCVFVDAAKNSLDLAKENAAALGVTDRSRFILKHAAKLPKREGGLQQFSLTFLDPPYGKELAETALVVLDGHGWLVDGAICIVEEEKSYTLPSLARFEVLDARDYGDTKITTLRYASAPV